jgi:anion transporter
MLNAFPDWIPYYIAYSNLKKHIYLIEKEISNESSPLLPMQFKELLDQEFFKIQKFYIEEKSKLSVIEFPKSTLLSRSVSLPASTSAARFNKNLKDVKDIIELYVQAYNLREYIGLNLTGFSKILKKYEKVTGQMLKQEYMEQITSQIPFDQESIAELEDILRDILEKYSQIATNGDLEAGLKELQGHVHERVVFYRNTIWKDMVEAERKSESVKIQEFDKEFSIFGVKVKIPIIHSKFLYMIMGIVIFITLVLAPTFEAPEQRYCLAILVFASYLWALEVIPLFVTALLVPFLVVVFRVLREPVYDAEKHIVDYHRLTSKEAAKKIFSDMFGPVIMLLLGGFSLAAALSKHHIAKSLAGAVLSKAGDKPVWIILTNMFVSTFSSMWISNVAAPVLCFSLVLPILRNLPSRSNYAKALVLGIAMAANVGGMASPISSPQNIIAISTMSPEPSWGQWFLIALPVCIILDLIIWAVLILVFKPNDTVLNVPEVASYSNFTKFNGTQNFILGITFLTIFLWCIESKIEYFIGDMGVIAIIPILAFFGTGILTKDDWNSMLWSVVILAMGGISLGKAVDSSGLLKIITGRMTPYLSTLSPFYCLVLFSGIVLVITTFISHTVGALILLPVIKEVGDSLPNPQTRTMLMAAALMCSGGMGNNTVP